MACHNPGCLGDYDFDRIADYARKRFIEGYSTIALLEQAKSDREKEEIVLVSMLNLEQDVILHLQLRCRYSVECKLGNCVEQLRKKIEHELALERL